MAVIQCFMHERLLSLAVSGGVFGVGMVNYMQNSLTICAIRFTKAFSPATAAFNHTKD